MAKKDLSYPAPDIGVEPVHTLYVLDSMFIGRVESAYERIDTLLALDVEFFILFCDDGIGCAVVITFAVVIEIVLRSFPLVFRPLLGDGESEHYRFLYIGPVHMGDETLEAGCFLEEIHRMYVGVYHRILGATKRLKCSVSGLNDFFYLSIVESY